MYFIDMLRAILENKSLKIRLTKLQDPPNLHLGDEVNGTLPPEARQVIFDLQRLIAHIRKRSNAQLARLPKSKRRSFRNRKEFWREVGIYIVKAADIRSCAARQTGITEGIITEIVHKHIPGEKQSDGNAYFLTRKSKLLRGIG